MIFAVAGVWASRPLWHDPEAWQFRHDMVGARRMLEDRHASANGAVARAAEALTRIERFPARAGEALVLTCGHVFRDSQGKGRVTVDLFGPGAPKNVVGQVIGYDLKRDVGLVSFHPGVPITVARLAPPGYAICPTPSA